MRRRHVIGDAASLWWRRVSPPGIRQQDCGRQLGAKGICFAAALMAAPVLCCAGRSAGANGPDGSRRSFRAGGSHRRNPACKENWSKILLG
jgi:hypothetical protein